MKDKILKLSENLEIDSEVYDNKIDVWKAFFLTVVLGFTGYHWFFLGKAKLGIARISLSAVTLIVAILAFVGVIASKDLSIIIIVALILISFIWTTVDLFLINNISNKNDSLNESKATERVTENIKLN